MTDDELRDKQLHITPAIRDRHNYHLDTAWKGRYLRRLPDRTLVYADEYEERLQEYLARQNSDESVRGSD